LIAKIQIKLEIKKNLARKTHLAIIKWTQDSELSFKKAGNT
jgi:hypothetical protein